MYSKCQPYIYSILIFAVIITFEIKWYKTFFNAIVYHDYFVILILRQFNHLTRKITLTEINDYFFIKNDSCQILPWNSQCAFQGRFRFKKKLNEGTSIILKKRSFPHCQWSRIEAWNSYPNLHKSGGRGVVCLYM